MTWRAQKTIYRDGTDLVYYELWDNIPHVAKPVTFSMEKAEGGVIEAPTLTLPMNQGQELLQALWDAGFRPNDGAGSGAQADALMKHIAFAERMADGLLARFTLTVSGEQ